MPARASAVSLVAMRSGRRLVAGLLAGLVLAAAGCVSHPKAEEIGPVPPQSFVSQWKASVSASLKGDVLRNIYVRGDSVYAISQNNQVFVFSAAGGKLLYADQLIKPGTSIRPPVILPESKVVFPTVDSLEVYDHLGRRVQSIKLDKPTRGPGVAVGNILYIGVDSPTGGRLAALDLSVRAPTADQVATAKKLNVEIKAQTARILNVWEVLTGGGIQAAPVAFQGIIYAGGTDGQVWAINEQGDGIWALPDGKVTFRADGPIHGDLKVDEVGLYVPCLDGKLYCIDRGSGRIKWTYYAGAPLETSPIVSANTIYQYVPDQGLVAIDKQSHGLAQAKWINAHAGRFLSEDDKYVYAQQDDGYLIGLDKTNGYRMFRGTRNDLALFSPDLKDKTICAATPDGRVISISPILKPGTVGELVLDLTPRPFEMFASAR